MNRRTYRLWHHWLAIIGGFFLAIFTVTGVVILLPKHLPWPSVPEAVQPAAAVDLSGVTVSPAEAVARARTIPGREFRLLRVELAPMGPHMVYTLETNRGQIRINAATGEPTAALTAEEAEAVVRARYGFNGGTLVHTLEDQRSWRYWGDAGLPAYVFSQPESRSVIYAVGLADGALRVRTNSMRLQDFMGRSHTLWPVALLTGSPRVHNAALLLTGLLSLLLVATGFFLVLPLPKRRQGESVKNPD